MWTITDGNEARRANNTYALNPYNLETFLTSILRIAPFTLKLLFLFLQSIGTISLL